MARALNYRLGVCGALLLLTAPAALADFHMIRRIDLTPHFGELGNNPFNLASDGTYAYVGGYRGAANIGTIGILQINLGDPDDYAVLPGGTIDVGQFRYYGGMVYQDGVLYALVDRPNGDVHFSNVRAIDVATGELVPTFWGDFEDGDGIVYEPAALAAPALGGLAIDPGFGETHDGAGLSILGFGSGRRGLIDILDGTTIYNFTSGMIVTDVSGACTPADSTSWRDHVYSPNGNVYMRRSNQVQKADRSGANSVSAWVHLTDALNADGSARIDCGDGKPVQLRVGASSAGQHLTFVPATSAGAEGHDLLVFNDHYDNSTRTFASVVKLIDTNGVDLASTVQLLKANGDPLDTTFTPSGIGIYDFYYDATNDWLLVLDFSARDLYVFSGTAPGCGTPVQDADDDGDVDLVDHARLVDCLSRPGTPWSANAFDLAACQCLDADADGDVDLRDWALLQAAFN